MSFANNGSNFTPMTNHVDDYSKWFSALQQQYEKLNGWVFWSWKTELSTNPQMWDYQSRFFPLFFCLSILYFAAMAY